MCRPGSVVGGLIRTGSVTIMNSKNRRDEIFDFCYDLGLLWERHRPDLRFGEIISMMIAANPDIIYKWDTECLDLIREVLGG